MATVIHLVRSFRPIGGMEMFVIRLTREQAKLGHRVIVLCNTAVAPNESSADSAAAHPAVKIVKFGEARIKPRWLAAILFGRRCERWLDRNILSGGHEFSTTEPDRTGTADDVVIHSHERTWFHDVATFHGQVYRPRGGNKILRILSLRHFMNRLLERLLVSTSQGQVLVAVSEIIRDQLDRQYPGADFSGTPIIAPGTDRVKPAESHRRRSGGAATVRPIIGFAGKEWKRKGLVFALEIFRCFARSHECAEFWVFGSEDPKIRTVVPPELEHRVKIFGWDRTPSKIFDNLDLLLHPARSEPYGMIVTEALARQIPVVTSDHCGAHVEIQPGQGRVLSLSSDAETWAGAIDDSICAGFRGDGFSRPWSGVAEEYDQIYQAVFAQGSRYSLSVSRHTTPSVFDEARFNNP